jgi:aldehyde:ferredoxin oxidoreductase
MVPFTQIWGSEREAVAVFLNAVCGWNLSVDDVNNIALRNYYFNRCVSMREGYDPLKDDYLPERAFDEPIKDKYGTTWVWDRDEFEKEKKKYYVEILKLSEKGLPPREGMIKLGLEFAIPVLESLGTMS